MNGIIEYTEEMKKAIKDLNKLYKDTIEESVKLLPNWKKEDIENIVKLMFEIKITTEIEKSLTRTRSANGHPIDKTRGCP